MSMLDRNWKKINRVYSLVLIIGLYFNTKEYFLYRPFKADEICVIDLWFE